MSDKSPAISLFDVTGPVMTGPSSSHTAGAVRIGLMGRMIFGSVPEEIHIVFYGALSDTYKGHLTDSGVVAGLLGMDVDDPEIRQAYQKAATKGIPVHIHTERESNKNPNTIEMHLISGEREMSITGVTLGGGEILIEEIEGVKTDLRGKEKVILFTGCRETIEKICQNFNLSAVAGTRSTLPEGSKVLSVSAPDENIDVEPVFLKIQENAVPEVETRLISSLYEYGMVNPDPAFTSIHSVLSFCRSEAKSLPEAALHYEHARSGLSSEMIREMLLERWKIMEDSIQKGLDGPNHMVGGLMCGRDAQKMMSAFEKDRLVSGSVLSLAVARAIASMEANASMGRVVACPTAGACGVIPGVFSSVAEYRGFSKEIIVDGLLVSSLFGVLVAMRAPISGALGGCQSEIGVASAMAAAGIAQMAGGSRVEVCQAFALALKSMLGLICDPVAGPVEVPCIKRNAIGVANSLSSCDMALSAIESVIPPDEVVDALINVQHLLPRELRGSTSGGLGSTKTGCRLKKEWLERCSGN